MQIGTDHEQLEKTSHAVPALLNRKRPLYKPGKPARLDSQA